MVLHLEYRADLVDHFRHENNKLFEDKGLDKNLIMLNEPLMDELWVRYQKDVSEYDVPPYQAFRQILNDKFNIPEPDTYDTK